jgi:murein DD-endopeptidase MepM/ murein hydrolase activator NlpD
VASYRNERRIIQRAARKNGIDPAILWGLYGAESDFGRNKNESSAGAQGPFQFMPGTAAGMGIDPHNFKQAAYGAARYLSQYKSRGVAGMLAAYNAGPNGNPNNPETQNYIRKVPQLARTWSPPKGGGPGAAGAGVAGSAPSASGAVSGPSAAILEAAQAQPLPQGSEGLSAVLASMMERPSIPPSSAGVAPPSFAASPAMAAGAPQLGGGGGPSRRPDISSLLAAIGGQRGETVQSAPDPALMLTQGAAPAAGGGGGRGVARAPGGPLRGAKPGNPVLGGKPGGGNHGTSGLAGYSGVDYFAKPGTTAVAPISGKVVRFSGHDPKLGAVQGAGGPLGWSLYIKGSDGHMYYLTHMGSRSVRVGQRVRQGQPIGTVANYDKFGRPSHIHMGRR